MNDVLSLKIDDSQRDRCPVQFDTRISFKSDRRTIRIQELWSILQTARSLTMSSMIMLTSHGAGRCTKKNFQ